MTDIAVAGATYITGFGDSNGYSLIRSAKGYKLKFYRTTRLDKENLEWEDSYNLYEGENTHESSLIKRNLTRDEFIKILSVL